MKNKVKKLIIPITMSIYGAVFGEAELSVVGVETIDAFVEFVEFVVFYEAGCVVLESLYLLIIYFASS